MRKIILTPAKALKIIKEYYESKGEIVQEVSHTIKHTGSISKEEFEVKLRDNNNLGGKVMKFIPKDQPSVELKLGDVIEYRPSINKPLIRAMIIKGYDDEGAWGYAAINLDENIFAPMGGNVFHKLEDLLDNFKHEIDFRIIKSENLELREV